MMWKYCNVPFCHENTQQFVFPTVQFCSAWPSLQPLHNLHCTALHALWPALVTCCCENSAWFILFLPNGLRSAPCEHGVKSSCIFWQLNTAVLCNSWRPALRSSDCPYPWTQWILSLVRTVYYWTLSPVNWLCTYNIIIVV
jgi:hypothetical protein